MLTVVNRTVLSDFVCVVQLANYIANRRCFQLPATTTTLCHSQRATSRDWATLGLRVTVRASPLPGRKTTTGTPSRPASPSSAATASAASRRASLPVTRTTRSSSPMAERVTTAAATSRSRLWRHRWRHRWGRCRRRCRYRCRCRKNSHAKTSSCSSYSSSSSGRGIRVRNAGNITRHHRTSRVTNRPIAASRASWRRNVRAAAKCTSVCRRSLCTC